MMRATVLLFFMMLIIAAPLKAQDVQGSPFCPFMEGVPLPLCSYPKYHTCNSGNQDIAYYNRVDIMIKTVDDPSLDKCAQNNIVCSTTCTEGPDGRSCTQNCQCTSPKPNPQNCHTMCSLCQKNEPIDYGITCDWRCGQPSHFPLAISENGNVYMQVDPSSTPACTSNLVNQCAAGTSTGGPTSLSQCKIDFPTPKAFSVTNPEECCYQAGGIADQTPGHFGVTRKCGAP